MNKKLLALAVAGACVAPTAMAQTANPVTLYGRIYLTVENVEADAAGTTAALAKRTRMVDQSSYLGVRGTEDLGGGLKAFFQLETAFNPDEASGTFANRNSGVGLQGGWGSVLLGRWDTPMKVAMTAVDPYGDLTAGDITGAALDQGNFSRRNGNLVQYWSPNMGGVSVRLAHMPDEGRTADAKPTVTSASLTYNKGALYLAAAYEEHKDQVGTTTTRNSKEEGFAFAGRFGLGNLRLMGHYGEYKKTGQPTDKSYLVGADYAMGKHVLLASFQNAEAGSADCDMFSIGYRYDFSKRTFFIASYTEVDNSNGMNCRFGSDSPTRFGADGQDLTAISAGIRHVF